MKLLRLLTLLALTVAITAAPLATHAQAAAPASTDPIADLQRDTHSGLTVAANPLTDPEQAKSIFGKADPMPVGVLPVEVFLKNDSQQPIRVDIDTIQLTVHTEHNGRQDIDWLSAQEVATLIVHPEGVAPKKPQHIAGIPLPSSDKKVEKLAATLRPLTLDGEVVAPMSMLHGYLYFNVAHEMKLANGASIYVPNVYSMPSLKPLMFFEVPIGKKPATTTRAAPDAATTTQPQQ